MSERTAPPRRLIIITDLDGSLLHPRTYSFEEAGPALELIRQRQIPLVLCSSKTRKEIEVYGSNWTTATRSFPRTEAVSIFRWDISLITDRVNSAAGMR